MRTRKLMALSATFLALGFVAGPFIDAANAERYRRWNSYRTTDVVPAGSPLVVRLDTEISTNDANRGDTWSGTVIEPVYVDGRLVIPDGAPVQGVVTSARQGTHSNRPMLALEVRKVSFDGRTYAVDAETEPIIAGTNRSKKIGAVVGGAAAGALLGGVVGGKKGAVIGGLLGGAGTYGLTRNRFRTMKLDEGTELIFTTREALVARR